jgi:hypothetical protein
MITIFAAAGRLPSAITTSASSHRTLSVWHGDAIVQA